MHKASTRWIAGLLLGIAWLTVMCSSEEQTDPTVTPVDTRPVQPGASRVATEPAPTPPELDYSPPTPPASSAYREARHQMVDRQIARPLDTRRPVTDERVLAAMRLVPRHVFVPSEVRRLAYSDRPLPIGYGQTISQPYIVALMTEQLGLRAGMKVLEIGTGSGYQAAVLACITPEVYTIEIVQGLAQQAEQTLFSQGFDMVHCRYGDGFKGWPEAAPFDAIIMTCAPADLPEPLWDQLKPGGRIVAPLGEPYAAQHLEVISKTLDGERRSRTLIPVRFVPMTREKTSQ
jgi:protein-L-isoaspartate(D-aspartate) O-methyltransferase